MTDMALTLAALLVGFAGLVSALVVDRRWRRRCDLLTDQINQERADGEVRLAALATELTAQIEGERHSLAVQITAGHDSAVSEVTGLVEALRDRNLTDTSWLVAQTLNQAPATGA